LAKDVSKTLLRERLARTMQINCNLCHRYDRETPSADYIMTEGLIPCGASAASIDSFTQGQG